MRRLFKWFGKVFRKVFRRPETIEMTREKALRNIISEIDEKFRRGQVNIYNGTGNGLRLATADIRSTVYIIEIINPPSRKMKLTFWEYISKLKKNI